MKGFTKGNHITLLRNGEEYFPALIEAISHARYEIFLESYIFRLDVVGKKIAESLEQAALRGVRVHCLLDAYGSQGLPSSFLKQMERSGVQYMFYREGAFVWTLQKKRLRRLHRKLALIDRQVGFVGGINIIDDYNVPKGASPRVDYAVKIEGALIPTLYRAMHQLWRGIALLKLRPDFVKTQPYAIPMSRSVKNGIEATLLFRDNILHRHDIENAYLDAIESAKHEIIIASAYFFPGWRFRNALFEAAKRGVKIKLLLQGRVEIFAMYATHAFYDVFLKHGVEIYEYRKSFMHSKVAVIDSHWATVGSSNIDPFSLLLAREANVVIRDNHFAQYLRADIIRSIDEGGQAIVEESWRRRSILARTLSWVAYGIYRLFMSRLTS
jgi:cardiolipin synthase A/B